MQIVRHWHILKSLPIIHSEQRLNTRGLTATQIKAQLAQYPEFQGITLRQIQKDLNLLSSLFEIYVDSSRKPFEWYLVRDPLLPMVKHHIPSSEPVPA